MLPNYSNFRALTSFVSSLLVLLIALVPVVAVAEKADRDKPMNIEADNLLHDDLRQVSIFTGRAILTKGTLVLRGAQIEIHEDPDGYQTGIVLPEKGQRAFFRQKREGLNEFIEGEALRIDYDGKSDRVKLTDQAEIRRYVGTVKGDVMTGQVIVYDNLADMFTIDGQQPGRGAEPGRAGRVRATLVPKDKTTQQDKK